MGRITVFGGPERRRRWSDEERAQILSEAFAPGAHVARVARQHDMSTSLIYTWRRKLRRLAADAAPSLPVATEFAEAVVVDDAVDVAPTAQPAIIVELAKGRRVSIFASASPTLAAAVLASVLR